MKQKISERAVELMVEAHKKNTIDPEHFRGCSTWYDYLALDQPGYPSPASASSAHILQALDEYQADQEKKSLDAVVKW